jgi:hypothetical protein
MGMYFSTLSSLTVIFCLAGILSIPNIEYYSSNKYDSNRQDKFSLLNILKFSTICTSREWVKCENCPEYVWDNIFTRSYYGNATDPNTGGTVTLINRTTCLPAQFEQGMWNFGVLLLLIVCISVYNM